MFALLTKSQKILKSEGKIAVVILGTILLNCNKKDLGIGFLKASLHSLWGIHGFSAG